MIKKSVNERNDPAVSFITFNLDEGPLDSDLFISTCDLLFHKPTVRFHCYMPSSKRRARCLEAKYPLHKQCIITSVSQFLAWKRPTNREGLWSACQNKA